MLDNWQRIEKIVKWSSASSVNAFARDIGLNRGENLYQIKRGNNGISRELAELITSKYPNLSKAWILTGEGEMLIQTELTQIKLAIPYYNADAIGIVRSLETVKTSTHIFIPEFKDCDFAAVSFGDAMTPSIPNGSIVILQKTEVQYLRPGDEYLIISPSFDGIRRVRRDQDKEYLRLEPRNSADFDDIYIDPGTIESAYQVKGVIIKKSL